MPDDILPIDARVDAALRAMAAPPFVAPELTARVAARAVLAGTPVSRATDRTMKVAALLAVVALSAAALSVEQLLVRPANPVAPPTMIGSASPTRVLPLLAARARAIVFELDAPTAHSVQVLGDFNRWARNATAMERGADGRWRITTLLPPGRYVYAFLVDGRRFVSDPVRDTIEDPDFGVTGSELVVGEAP